MAISILSLGSLPVKLITKPHRKICDREIKSVFLGKKVLCVGTGPSLDEVNIKAIKDGEKAAKESLEDIKKATETGPFKKLIDSLTKLDEKMEKEKFRTLPTGKANRKNK